MGSLNGFRAVLVGATVIALLAASAIGQWQAALVLGAAVIVHGGLFVYQHLQRTRDAAGLEAGFEGDLREVDPAG